MSDSMPSQQQRAAERLITGQAWDDYCNMIRLAGHEIERWGDGINDLDRAEWYRFLTRLMRNGLERFVENRDSGNPQLRDAPWRCFINLQNPDQDHLMAEFSAEGEYVIRGEPGTVPYFIISTWSAPEPGEPGAEDWAVQGLEGLERFNPALLRTGHFLASDDLQRGPDGHFQIVVSRTEHPGNWLRMDADTTGIIVRVVYSDRQQERPPALSISPLDGVHLQPLDPAALSTNLAKAGQLVLGYTQLVNEWWQNFSPHPNQIRFSMERYLSNGGVADRQFGFGAWQKAEHEALVLEFYPPECEYWIFQICNVWQENLDIYELGRGYVTSRTVQLEDSGLVRIVIADRNPGVANWIDSFAHVQGLMGLRLIQTKGVPEVRCYRGPLAALEQDGIEAIPTWFEEQQQ